MSSPGTHRYYSVATRPPTLALTTPPSENSYNFYKTTLDDSHLNESSLKDFLN